VHRIVSVLTAGLELQAWGKSNMIVRASMQMMLGKSRGEAGCLFIFAESELISEKH